MKNEITSKTSDLRQKAEELWIKKEEGIRQKAEGRRKQVKGNPSTHQPINLSDSQVLKLVHEMEVHQIELEMLNEELILTKERAKVSAERYTELYDFAPLGYFTLSKEGIIIALNINGSIMLGKEMSNIKNSSFGSHFSYDSKSIYSRFLEKVFTSNLKETCEVTLSVNGHPPVYVQLIGIITENGEQCLVVGIDISDRKKAEEILKQKMDELERFHRLTVGRELNMIELKKEVNELLIKLGQDEKYKIVG
jgi:hypothetical protein